jgi:hypothetical protein
LYSKGLTLKIGSVKRNTPASRAGLWKMDYLIAVGFAYTLFPHCKSGHIKNTWG